MRDEIGEMFGRRNDDGTISVLYVSDGLPVTRIDASVYPVGSDLSARYEHAEGIILDAADAAKLGIDIE